MKKNILFRSSILFALMIFILFFNANSVSAFEGCKIDYSVGNSACYGVSDWGSTDINHLVKKAAKNNPGTTYMGWCPYDGAKPYATNVVAACGCPSLPKPAPGDFSSGTCSACGNPVYRYNSAPTCEDECYLGQTKCRPGDDLWVCGDFDSDPCFEWGFDKSCDFSHESESYFVCENEDSVEYKEVGEGFCNDQPGYNDYCDSTEDTIRVDETDCGYTTCEDEEFCQNNDVYSTIECVERGCRESTGICYEQETSFTEKEQECGEDTQTEDYCEGENVVYEIVDRGCTESNGHASCFEDPDKIIVDECGPDTCTPYTEMDPYTQEYVYDEESCIENGYAYCSPNDEEVHDMCITSDILWQAYCNGQDSAFQEFNCGQKTGCYEFQVEQCFYCEDNYGNCYEKNCTVTGEKYRTYSCSSGACQYEEKELVDEDMDFKDDEYCDDCIDVDRDGICDDVDNCPGVKNSNQIDTDKDGLGNMCDKDRDNDGYSENVDCDDWNPNINPGMKEIPNNNIDDDCNPDTPDFVVNTAKEALYVDIQMTEEYLKAGEDAVIMVTVRNMASKDMDNVQLTVSIPRYQIYQRKLLYEVESGEIVSRIFEIRLPENLKTDYEYLRVSVSSNQYKRIIYREIKLPQ